MLKGHAYDGIAGLGPGCSVRRNRLRDTGYISRQQQAQRGHQLPAQHRIGNLLQILNQGTEIRRHLGGVHFDLGKDLHRRIARQFQHHIGIHPKVIGQRHHRGARRALAAPGIAAHGLVVQTGAQRGFAIALIPFGQQLLQIRRQGAGVVVRSLFVHFHLAILCRVSPCMYNSRYLDPNAPPKEVNLMRAVQYLRVSMVEQVKGHSLDAQRTSTHALIQQRGWICAGEYVDAGISAKSDAHRPAFTQLLTDAQRGHFDVVVVDKVDRFYRHLKGLLTALETLHTVNVTFVSVQENLDFSTPWGKLTLTVLGMLAEIYLDNLSQETHKGKLARARKGHWNGSVPFGYCRGTCATCRDPNGPDYCPYAGDPDRNAGTHLIAHPVESVAVQRAFALYLTGHYSDGALAEYLNADALALPDGRRIPFRTKGLPGRWPPGPFTKDSLRELLQQRADYVETFPGQHPALVSPEDFAQAQALRQQLARRSRHSNGVPRVYLLSGLLICAQCGKPLRAMTSGGRRYYRDATRIDHAGACQQPTVRAEAIEAQVVAFLQQLALPEDWRTGIMAQLLPPAQLKALDSQKETLTARWTRARELYLEGLLDKAQLQEEKWHYQAGMTDLTPCDLSAIMEAGQVWETLPEVLSTGSTLQQNKLLRLGLAGVWVKGHTLTAVQANLHFYPLMTYCRSGSDGKEQYPNVKCRPPISRWRENALSPDRTQLRYKHRALAVKF